MARNKNNSTKYEQKEQHQQMSNAFWTYGKYSYCHSVCLNEMNPIRTVCPNGNKPSEYYRYYSWIFHGWAINKRNHYVSGMPADKLTHINYAFAGVSTSRVM